MLTPIQTDRNTPRVSQLTLDKLKYNLHELTHAEVITYMSSLTLGYNLCESTHIGSERA